MATQKDDMAKWFVELQRRRSLLIPGSDNLLNPFYEPTPKEERKTDYSKVWIDYLLALSDERESEEKEKKKEKYRKGYDEIEWEDYEAEGKERYLDI